MSPGGTPHPPSPAPTPAHRLPIACLLSAEHIRLRFAAGACGHKGSDVRLPRAQNAHEQITIKANVMGNAGASPQLFVSRLAATAGGEKGEERF